jgi:hypothetical protein
MNTKNSLALNRAWFGFIGAEGAGAAPLFLKMGELRD